MKKEVLSEKNNKLYWNTVKAIGIISIVIGHCSSVLAPFVYLYHLAIFFFVSGYLYSETKYGDDPYIYFNQKIKTNWKKYFIYSIIIILMHNVFSNLRMIETTVTFKFVDFISAIACSVLFINNETLAGALWFVPIIVFGGTIFSIIIFYSRKIGKIFSKKKNNQIYKNVTILLLTLFLAILGIILNIEKTSLILHLQTALLVIPFFTAGYFTRNYLNINKILKFIPFIISFLILILCVTKFNILIELSIDYINGYGVRFYLVSFIGIYFCLYLAKLLIKFQKIGYLFNIIGYYSFEIMAFHFVAFKIVDFIYAKIFDITLYYKFPYQFGNLTILYLISGILLPILSFKFMGYLKNENHIKKLIKKIK